jgi:hypothetical protein
VTGLDGVVARPTTTRDVVLFHPRLKRAGQNGDRLEDRQGQTGMWEEMLD